MKLKKSHTAIKSKNIWYFKIFNIVDSICLSLSGTIISIVFCKRTVWLFGFEFNFTDFLPTFLSGVLLVYFSMNKDLKKLDMHNTWNVLFCLIYSLMLFYFSTCINYKRPAYLFLISWRLSHSCWDFKGLLLAVAFSCHSCLSKISEDNTALIGWLS